MCPSASRSVALKVTAWGVAHVSSKVMTPPVGSQTVRVVTSSVLSSMQHAALITLNLTFTTSSPISVKMMVAGTFSPVDGTTAGATIRGLAGASPAGAAGAGGTGEVGEVGAGIAPAV